MSSLYFVRCICLFVAVVCGSASQVAQAEIMMFTVQVNKPTYAIGESVAWSLFATVSNSSTSNWGISTVSANLFDSKGEILVPGTTSSQFAPYSFSSGGTYDGMNKKLLEVASTLFTQSNTVAQAIDPINSTTNNNLGPLLVASGSYVPMQVGNHTLAAEPGSANSFFTAPGQLIGNGGTYTIGTNQSVAFLVVAVPEPTALMNILFIASCSMFRRMRRSPRT